MAEVIGHINQEVISILGLSGVRAGTPILIGESNIEHIRKRHPYEFDKYFPDIKEIINSPDLVGINPSDHSIAYVKEYLVASEYVKVAVRVTAKGQYYAKSLHSLSTYNAERYIERGTLKRLDKK